jgi:transcriptional regulator with XRE-family HTH domain
MRTLRGSIAPLVGPSLRCLRQRKGLSLKELAERIGSSVSAIHRYESGWGRFELRTLRRLAAALDARLDIRLDPVHRDGSAGRASPAQLVRTLRPLFWDVELKPEHLDENPQWVLRRVLRFGDWQAVRMARVYFGDDAVREAAAHRSMDPRTRRLWQVILGPKRDRT